MTEAPLMLPEWRAAYQAAVVEVDDTRLMQRIEAAQAAITHRLQALNGSIEPEEAQALLDATHALHVLRHERL